MENSTDFIPAEGETFFFDYLLTWRDIIPFSLFLLFGKYQTQNWLLKWKPEQKHFMADAKPGTQTVPMTLWCMRAHFPLSTSSFHTRWWRMLLDINAAKKNTKMYGEDQSMIQDEPPSHRWVVVTPCSFLELTTTPSPVGGSSWGTNLAAQVVCGET